VAWALDDWEQFAFVPELFGPGVIEDPAKSLAMWTSELTEAHRHGSCFTLTVHPFLSGRLGRLRALETLIETMQALPGLWLAPARDIAQHVRSLALTPRVFPQPEIPT
jgi:peptidoglycan-N-acetylglucosamine deacetylase